MQYVTQCTPSKIMLYNHIQVFLLTNISVHLGVLKIHTFYTVLLLQYWNSHYYTLLL